MLGRVLAHYRERFESPIWFREHQANPHTQNHQPYSGCCPFMEEASALPSLLKRRRPRHPRGTRMKCRLAPCPQASLKVIPLDSDISLD
jgi:hypothetical protein